MKFYIETPRLILRDFQESDLDSFYELDSDPLVHTYLGNNPVLDKNQALETIYKVQKQYEEFGIGRWSTIEKSSGNFIGWSGLKFLNDDWAKYTNQYDVGYRFMPKYWGNGYATEASLAALEFGFTTLKLNEIIGTSNIENKASLRVLEKCGLKHVEPFKWKDIDCYCLKITKEDWESQEI